MAEDGAVGGISRRRFLRDAGAATVAASGVLAGPAFAGLPPSKQRGTTVAVFGGGIAGLTVAHELAERGFDVTIYERRAWGGKARSTELPGSASGGRRPLPGEHGWRVFFGFYQNLPDTFRRIPFGANPHGAFDNLVAGPQILAARDGGRADLTLPMAGTLDPGIITPALIYELVTGALLQLNLPPDGVAFFARKLVVYLSSSDARRIGQWEQTTWTDFTAANSFGQDYRRILVDAFSEVVQASKAERTSAQFPAHVLEMLVYSILGPAANGATWRFMDRPTNEALFDPWLARLTSLGVGLQNLYELVGWDVSAGRIAGARVRTPDGTISAVNADWYVSALPVERARALWSPAILAADPSLTGMSRLDTGWMNGLKFFLRRATPIIKGVVDYVDSPWRLTSISQAQFWPLDFSATYGDGNARESLSVIISDLTTPGVIFGKPANACTPAEIASEAWEQMKRHLNDTGRNVLSDDLLLSSNIDPGMIPVGGHLVSDDPLVLPTVGQRPDRPDVTTAIPNLILAGDYLKSDWEVANMETANYNGRRAANAILDKAGSPATRCATIKTYRPPEWEPFKLIDAQRYSLGQPNLFDADLLPTQVTDLLHTVGQLQGTIQAVISGLIPRL